MIFELSHERTLACLTMVGDCPDGFVDLSAVLHYIHEWNAVFSVSRPDMRSALPRLITTIFDELLREHDQTDGGFSSIDRLCKKLALSIVMAGLFCDARFRRGFANPVEAMVKMFSEAFMVRLELELKSVPYWLVKSNDDRECRAYVDISGCATLARSVPALAMPTSENIGRERIYLEGAWIQFIDKFRRSRGLIEFDGPQYPFDDQSWRPWWLNQELPEVEDDGPPDLPEDDEEDL